MTRSGDVSRSEMTTVVLRSRVREGRSSAAIQQMEFRPELEIEPNVEIPAEVEITLPTDDGEVWSALDLKLP